MGDFMSGPGGYQLSGGMAQSGNTNGDKTNGQTVNFGSTGDNSAVMLLGFAVLVFLALKK